jgi:hypothetical protein
MSISFSHKFISAEHLSAESLFCSLLYMYISTHLKTMSNKSIVKVPQNKRHRFN